MAGKKELGVPSQGDIRIFFKVKDGPEDFYFVQGVVADEIKTNVPQGINMMKDSFCLVLAMLAIWTKIQQCNKLSTFDFICIYMGKTVRKQKVNGRQACYIGGSFPATDCQEHPTDNGKVSSHKPGVKW
jgi:hypothetical protein